MEVPGVWESLLHAQPGPLVRSSRPLSHFPTLDLLLRETQTVGGH